MISSLLPSACMFLAVGLWYVRPALGPGPLLLVALGLGIQLLVLRRGLVRTPFDPPLALFLFSAALGAWLSARADSAWPRFWEVVSSIVLYRAIVELPERVRTGRGVTIAPRRIFFGLLPTMISLYFLLTADWSLWTGKMAWLDQVRRQLAGLHVNLPNYLWSRTGGVTRFHPNHAGGLIAALLPLQVAALLGDRPYRVWLALPLLGISLIGLLLTASRAAWMALAGVAALWTLWYLSRRWLTHRTQRARLVFWLGLAAVPLFGLLLVGADMAVLHTDALPRAWLFPIWDRLTVFRNSLDLALDYPITGLGLGGYQMAYASYVMLLHVGFLSASHNLFLQVWLEQGFLGLLSLAWLIVAAIRCRPVPEPGRPLLTTNRHDRGDGGRQDRQSWLWQWAAFASLGVILIHGLVDVPLYIGRGIHLLFVPLAVLGTSPWGKPSIVLVAPSGPATKLAAAETAGARPALTWRWVCVSVTMIVVLGLALQPTARAALQANLGAVAQTRAELSVYKWPQWPIQDAVRRSPKVDLAPAIARYQAALALDGANAAANRRLGQIELSLGQYDAAREHLLAAYTAAPDQRATRQLLGESYAIAGDVTRAADLWRGLDLSQGQLPLRRWWYEQIGEPQNAGYIQEAETLSASPTRHPFTTFKASPKRGEESRSEESPPGDIP